LQFLRGFHLQCFLVLLLHLRLLFSIFSCLIFSLSTHTHEPTNPKTSSSSLYYCIALHCIAGKYLTIPRTEGISTTDIVGRMLLMTRSHHQGDTSLAASETDLQQSQQQQQQQQQQQNSPVPETETAAGSAGGGVSPTNTATASSTAGSPVPAGKEDVHSGTLTSPYKLASDSGTTTPPPASSAASGATTTATDAASVSAKEQLQPFIRKSRFLTTSRTIQLFGAGVQVRMAIHCFLGVVTCQPLVDV
jgi:hypothetical protein